MFVLVLGTICAALLFVWMRMTMSRIYRLEDTVARLESILEVPAEPPRHR